MSRTDVETYLRAESANPRYGRDGRASATAALDRFLAGEPLVRRHHRTDMGWSWLCPVPSCQEWRMGHASEDACRRSWLTHGRGHAEITPSWPAAAVVDAAELRAGGAP